MFICLLAARPQKAAAQQQAEIIEVTVDDMPRLPGVTPDFSTDRMQLSLKQTKEDPLLSIYSPTRSAIPTGSACGSIPLYSPDAS